MGKPAVKYQQVRDGEWQQPRMKQYVMICCDCGLAHRMDFRIVIDRSGEKPKLRVQLRAFRDKPLTRLRRKEKNVFVMGDK